MSPPAYLVDTDVISETARPAPDPNVVRWLADQDALALASVSVYELTRGIEKLAAGRRRRFLEAWLARLLDGAVEILAFDRDAAIAAARLERDARHRGRSIDVRDLFILASAKTRGIGVATRNVDHFRGFGVGVYDPFTDVHAV